MHPDTRIVAMSPDAPPPKGSAMGEKFWRERAAHLAGELSDAQVRIAAFRDYAAGLEDRVDGRDLGLVKRICLTFAAGLGIGFLLGVLAR